MPEIMLCSLHASLAAAAEWPDTWATQAANFWEAASIQVGQWLTGSVLGTKGHLHGAHAHLGSVVERGRALALNA